MRLEQLKYLIEIANNKSINKAAQNLYITQPALSIAINALEEELQYPLLKRTKKGVMLTEDGARVVREAQMILDTIQGWYLRSDVTFTLEGAVHILSIPSISIALSNTLIIDLQRKYPKLSIFVHEQTPQHILPYLENSAVNIGLTSYFRYKEKDFLREIQESRQWHAEKLSEDVRCVMMSANNPLAQKEILTVADLRKLTLAYYSDTSDNISESYRKYFNQDQTFRLGSQESILRLVAGDGAVAIFPEKATRSSYFRKSGMIRAIPTELKEMETSYFLLYPDQKIMSLNEIRMLDIIREQFCNVLNELCKAE